MSFRAGPTLAAFNSLIDASNPLLRFGTPLSSSLCSNCLKFRAVACGTMPSLGCFCQFLGTQGCPNHLCGPSSLRLFEFGLEVDCFERYSPDYICLIIKELLVPISGL